MKTKIIYTSIFIVAVVWFVFNVNNAVKALGLDPDQKSFEEISTAQVSNVSIRYFYTPPNHTKQEIKFKTEDKEIVEKLKKSVQIKSVSGYDVVLTLACENNAILFPDSAKTDVSIFH